MKSLQDKFKQIWLVDFEFNAAPGEPPEVICMVAREFVTGKTYKYWQDELLSMSSPPVPVGGEALYVAYYASAEMGCHLALGWNMPMFVLDLFTEFRVLTNGLPTICGNGLLGALSWFGLDSIQAAEKESMRELALRGGPWTAEEKTSLLDYCESDVAALALLLTAMLPSLDIERALRRGQYMKSAAQIEFNGIPLDIDTFNSLTRNWEAIQDQLIQSVDAAYGVYEGRTFKTDRFLFWLAKRNIPWPLHPSGRHDLSDDAFKTMAHSYPELTPLRELRVTLSRMRLSNLAVGSDGRNRCMLSAFRARTGRNQPSTSKYIFGPAVWLRSLIKPDQGYGLAYIDWAQQEFGIAAALSGDLAMQEAYLSGDPYLAFAKQVGAVPSNATKQTHGTQRNLYKACVLAVQYGMGVDSLATKISQPRCVAKTLLDQHKQAYDTFWSWSDGALDYAMLHGKLWTAYGWTVHVGEHPNPRFLRNFLMQGNGAEMLRLACTMMTSSGIRVCAPIHDAVLIEAPLEALDAEIEQAQELMAIASRLVLDGFELRTDVDVVRYPDRYMDERGRAMWDAIETALGNLSNPD